MSAALSLPLNATPHDAIATAVDAACARIAPAWPLDRSIAVNPWWGFVNWPFRAASARVRQLSGARTTLTPADYRALREDGRIDDGALAAALAREGLSTSVADFLRGPADTAAPTTPSWLFTAVLDAQRAQRGLPPSRDLVIHAIGQHCAAWFDRGQARWRAPLEATLYADWRAMVCHDDTVRHLRDLPTLAQHLRDLPADTTTLLREACMALGVAPQECEDYFTALLLDVNGWAGWCAYRAWQARLDGTQDAQLIDLLAIRLAWEWGLAAACADPALRQRWEAARRAAARPAAGGSDSATWVWQEALELHWQRELNTQLRQAPARAAAPAPRPRLQAVFCIDVRSERLRRALEACDDGVRTHGTAGFFGLPIAYRPLGSDALKPCLPGLLAPRLEATACAGTAESTTHLAQRSRLRHRIAAAWRHLRSAGTGGFAYVESAGLGAAWALVRDSLCLHRPAPARDGLAAAESAQLRPVLTNTGLAEQVALAADALRNMGLHGELAPLVLLVGHGSTSTNNPHAAALACGACGGHSGEVNARLLADLLNAPAVRAGLAARGIVLPEDTRFVAGLHDTTTDDVRLFGDDGKADGRLAQASAWLAQAASQVRAERAPQLGLAHLSPPALARALRRRAADWSQVRPEWGLADNAGFIAAPRERTRHMHLQGRCFLHDYDHRDDPQGDTLALILSAPMVVAHWINLQYYASTVDNHRWGSGDKTLHNVVGSGIGVFEGNGGDLRIGLPLQSVHDGARWRHTPQRLSVWVEAPPERITRALQRHEVVRQLVDGGWVHLFCIVPDRGGILRHTTRGGTRHWVAEGDRE